jgi:curli production assembly/transport component CsgG
MGEHNLNFSDNVDYVISERDDYYWRFGAGNHLLFFK